jgi:hypothetical protein
MIAPCIDEQTMLVAHVDISALDMAAIEQFAGEVLAQGMPAGGGGGTGDQGVQEIRKQMAMQRLAAEGFLARIRQLGGRHLFVVLNHQDLFPSMVGPAVLFKVESVNGAPPNGQAVADLLKSILPAAAISPLTADLVFCGWQPTLDRLKALHPAARPDLRLTGEAAGEAIVSATPDQRRTLRELMPTLPPELGGGSTADLVEGVENMRVLLAPPPNPHISVVFQHTPAGGARLEALLTHVRDLLLSDQQLGGQFSLPGQPDQAPAFRSLVRAALTPSTSPATTILSLDAAQLRDTGKLLSIPLQHARQRAVHVSVMSQMRQILQACYLYANDNHGNMPEKLELLVQGGMIKAEMLSSPETHRPYVYRRWVAQISRYPQGEQVPILWEEAPTPPAGRGEREMVVVGFLDGHCELLSAAAFDELLKKTEAWAAQQGGH